MFECRICHHNPIVLMTQKGKWFVTCSNYKCYSHGNEKLTLFNRKQDAINEWNKENPYNVIYHNIKLKNNFTFIELEKPIYCDTQTDGKSFNDRVIEYIESLKGGES